VDRPSGMAKDDAHVTASDVGTMITHVNAIVNVRELRDAVTQVVFVT
jgi:hypothetical protein